MKDTFSPEGQRNFEACVAAISAIPSAQDLRVMIERRFPRNATCWSQATDEIRDMARDARQMLEHEDPIDFRNIHSPAAWNQQGTDYIIMKYLLMRPPMRRAFFDRFAHWLR